MISSSFHLCDNSVLEIYYITKRRNLLLEEKEKYVVFQIEAAIYVIVMELSKKETKNERKKERKKWLFSLN